MEKEPKNLDISTLENIERPKKIEKSKTFNLIMDVELELSAILGETDIPLQKVLDITKGTIIELDNKTAQPIKLLANGCEIAKGEVVIIEDNFGLRITNISQQKAIGEENE
ncbi:MAG: FliM/FliN family flagellar motor switch protein [Candidatus Gastranaerophilales bacterium]|nr:FliM/FliN family flagellar motor switch protein [Candidatus Gastranaerophilales bacterium]